MLLRKNRNRICLNCGSKTTYIYKKNGAPFWHNYKNGSMCHRCYSRLIGIKKFMRKNPNYNRKWRKNNPIKYKRQNAKYSKIWNEKCLNFLGVRTFIGKKVRKGVCEECGKKIGDYYINCFGVRSMIKSTHIHHIKYYANNPLKSTIELCVSCHIKKHRRLNEIPIIIS